MFNLSILTLDDLVFQEVGSLHELDHHTPNVSLAKNQGAKIHCSFLEISKPGQGIKESLNSLFLIFFKT